MTKPPTIHFACGPTKGDEAVDPAYVRYDGIMTVFKRSAPIHVWGPRNRKLTIIKGPIPAVFVVNRNVFFGGDEAQDYISEPVLNPTYADLMRATKASMCKTRDFHHRFLEGVTRSPQEYLGGKPNRRVIILHIDLGS